MKKTSIIILGMLVCLILVAFFYFKPTNFKKAYEKTDDITKLTYALFASSDEKVQEIVEKYGKTSDKEFKYKVDFRSNSRVIYITENNLTYTYYKYSTKELKQSIRSYIQVHATQPIDSPFSVFIVGNSLNGIDFNEQNAQNHNQEYFETQTLANLEAFLTFIYEHWE